jgi:hypothetical protein
MYLAAYHHFHSHVTFNSRTCIFSELQASRILTAVPYCRSARGHPQDPSPTPEDRQAVSCSVGRCRADPVPQSNGSEILIPALQQNGGGISALCFTRTEMLHTAVLQLDCSHTRYCPSGQSVPQPFPVSCHHAGPPVASKQRLSTVPRAVCTLLDPHRSSVHARV